MLSLPFKKQRVISPWLCRRYAIVILFGSALVSILAPNVTFSSEPDSDGKVIYKEFAETPKNPDRFIQNISTNKFK
ncbi:hypothetical protein MNBD_GAMMA12-1293 [hydrothermal vent metagenome]|uniref:Uncharacterized protein n=1 Tax=hydrothermal vent metagenome TaxID=652676 RepID=A0A3B0Y2M9_9ZZZZ